MRRSQLSDVLLIAALCVVVSAALYLLFTSLGASPLVTALILATVTLFTGMALINAALRRWNSGSEAPARPSGSGPLTLGMAVMLLGGVMVYGLIQGAREANGHVYPSLEFGLPALPGSSQPAPEAGENPPLAADEESKWLMLPLGAALLGSLVLALALHAANRQPSEPPAELPQPARPEPALHEAAPANPSTRLDWRAMLSPDDEDEEGAAPVDTSWWAEQLSRDDEDLR